MNSCSRNDVTLSDSVLEHSKLSNQQISSRAPVVTINHQTISMDHERHREAPKPRLTVEPDSFSKKQQQEIFARQQLYSRAFSPFSLPNNLPPGAAGKLNKQLEQQLKQQHSDLGSLVDLYGRGEKDLYGRGEKDSHGGGGGQPAFPTTAQMRQGGGRGSAASRQQQPSPRSRSIPTELLVQQQERDRLLSQQQERLLAQQRQHAATSAARDHNPLFAQRQEALLHRPPHGSNHQHLQHSPYGGAAGVLGYPLAGLNHQLYKGLDPAQVTSASILQSLAGYHQQLQLAAAAAGKFGPLAHLYQTNSKPGSEEGKNTSHYGVIRP